MIIKDFDFTSIHAVRKQCWTYKTDGNTPIKKGKNLYPLEIITGCSDFKGFFVEVIKYTYGDATYKTWNDLGNSCIAYNAIHMFGVISRDFDLQRDIDVMKEYLLPYKGMNGFRLWLENEEMHGRWIPNAHIAGLYDNGETELATYYQKYHDIQKQQREEQYKRQEEEYKHKEREKEEKREAEKAAQINQAEQNIRERKDLKNELIDGRSIVLCLMDKYGIKVPIKTQGWFNQKLAFVKWIDGGITYSYYKTKGTNGSQTAFKYLNMLENAVNAV